MSIKLVNSMFSEACYRAIFCASVVLLDINLTCVRVIKPFAIPSGNF